MKENTAFLVVDKDLFEFLAGKEVVLSDQFTKTQLYQKLANICKTKSIADVPDFEYKTSKHKGQYPRLGTLAYKGEIVASIGLKASNVPYSISEVNKFKTEINSFLKKYYD